MNILPYIAQATPYTTTYQTSGAVEGAAAAAFAVMMLFAVFIGYAITAIFLMLIFKKAGVPGWAAWVPFYNNWKLLEIGGQQGFWSVLSIIPFVNIISAIMIYIALYHIGIKLGKSGAFVVLAIFLPLVWIIWLAVDKSVWNDEASPSRSLHKPTSTAPAQDVAQQVPAAQPTSFNNYSNEQTAPAQPVETLSQQDQSPTQDQNTTQNQ